VIGHTLLFPHSARLPYEMPKFSAVPPTPDTTGEWDEMAYPAGDGVEHIGDVRPAGHIVASIMTEARALLETQPARTR
jgi:enoyl-[acyl-carrier protein] reductase II